MHIEALTKEEQDDIIAEYLLHNNANIIERKITMTFTWPEHQYYPATVDEFESEVLRIAEKYKYEHIR